MARIEWLRIQNMSLARSMREAGFDIAVFDEYSNAVKKEAQKRAIRYVLDDLSDEYENKSGGRSITEVKRGVYVICLANPFAVSYENGDSEIIYIGRGNVYGRIRSHFEHSLFKFMKSLSGTDFTFYVAEPKRPGGGRANEYYKQVEHDLLASFKSQFGGEGSPYPLLNKNAGTNKNLRPTEGWDKPLSRQGKRPKWFLKPTQFWDFEKLG